jgi:hypothetical protein
MVLAVLIALGLPLRGAWTGKRLGELLGRKHDRLGVEQRAKRNGSLTARA